MIFYIVVAAGFLALFSFDCLERINETENVVYYIYIFIYTNIYFFVFVPTLQLSKLM